MMLFCFLLLGLVASAAAAVAGASCVINLDARSATFQPLLVQNGQFLYPSGSRVMQIAEGSNLQLVCHGTGLCPSMLWGRGSSTSISLTCNAKGEFVDANNTVVEVHHVNCTKVNEPDVRVTRNASCAVEGADGRTDNNMDRLALVQIGWNLTNQVFWEQIRLCVDELLYQTLWTSHSVVGRAIGFRDMTPDRPSFRRDVTGYKRLFPDFPSQTAIDTAYTKIQESKQMTKLLGSNLGCDGLPLIDTSTSGTAYFARGHLSPDAAFIYDVQQDATYFFSNCAPQFQTFNNGNWKALEGAVRDYAASKNQTVSVFTGTHGYLKYNDTNGNPVSIFTYTEGNHTWLPAPMYYWKVVHNTAENTAIAFIGLNDAHKMTYPVPLCNSICAKVSWTDWSLQDLSSGYMYCCQVEDLRQTVRNLPDLSVNGGSWPKLMVDVQQA